MANVQMDKLRAIRLPKPFVCIVQPGIALRLNHLRSAGDGRIRKSSLSERNPMRRVEKVQGKGALVLLQLKIVLVFGKILRHGDEFVLDVVPPIQHHIGRRTRRARRLGLRLALIVTTPFDKRC